MSNRLATYSDGLAVYTYKQIAAIKAADKKLGDDLHKRYSQARQESGEREQRAGERVEDEYNRLAREGKIAR